jgi:hypothetical protein
VPQAVVLVATRDIELALGLTENNASLLVKKAVADPHVIRLVIVMHQ